MLGMHASASTGLRMIEQNDMARLKAVKYRTGAYADELDSWTTGLSIAPRSLIWRDSHRAGEQGEAGPG
jgi:hypothetical protein